MPTIAVKCQVCKEYFDGSSGYSMYKGKGICKNCKGRLKEVQSEKKDFKKEEKQR